MFVAVLTLTLSLAACGGDDDGEIKSGGAADKPESSAPTATEVGSLAPCDLADEADVEAAYGEDLPPGFPGGGGHDEDGLSWQSDNCNWDVDDGLEVTLAVSVAEDYDGGELVCPQLDSFGTAGTPVAELGDGASWVSDEVDPNEGTLRVCLDDVNFDIDVESPDGSRDPDTLREQTVALAEVVLASLG